MTVREPSDARHISSPSPSPSAPPSADGGSASTGRPVLRHRPALTAGADGTGPVTATVAPTRRRWQVRSRLLPLVVGVVAVVALAGGAIALTQRGSSAADGYRTATAESRPVDQTLQRVGTIEPVAQATLGFPIAGTVAAVDVNVGDQISVGQQLAQLDTTSLDSAIADAQAALDQAELTLERALNGEDVSGGPGGGTGTGGSGAIAPASFLTGGGTAGTATTGRAAADPDLVAAQQAVLDAQQQVDSDLAVAQQALDDAQAVCAAVASTDDTGATEGEGDAGSSAAGITACQDALAAVLDAQRVVAASQNTLADASQALDDLLAERAEDTEDPDDPGTGGPQTSVTQPPGTGTPNTGAGEAPPASTDQTPSGPAGGQIDTSEPAATSSSPTAAELVAYQKAVDAAAADLTVAQQAATQATLVSPIAGTVQQIDLVAGDTVTASSSTAVIAVVGDGGYEVSTTVTVDDLPDLEPGQTVTVVPDGTNEPVQGELVRFGVVGTSSGTATTYPVTIGLTDAPDELRNGATASLSIVTARTGDATAVPTSAVHIEGGRATVTVLDDGTPTDVTVQTGAVGPTWTEITDGLDLGQTVVLADIDAPLPTSATNTGDTGGFTGPGR